MSSQCSHLITFFGLSHCLGCGFIKGMVAVKSYAMKVAMKMVVSCNPMLSYFYFTNQQKSLLIQNQLTSCAFIQTFWYDTSYYTTTDVQRNEGRTEIMKNYWSVCVCDQIQYLINKEKYFLFADSLVLNGKDYQEDGWGLWLIFSSCYLQLILKQLTFYK